MTNRDHPRKLVTLQRSFVIGLMHWKRGVHDERHLLKHSSPAAIARKQPGHVRLRTARGPWFAWAPYIAAPWAGVCSSSPLSEPAAGRLGPWRRRHLRPGGGGLRRQVLRSLGQAEDAEQQPAFMLAGPLPPGPGQRLGHGELPRLVAVGGPAHPAPAGGTVLLQTALLSPAARLSLGNDPGTAALDLNLGQARATAKRVIGEPPRQLSFHRRAGVMLGVRDRRPQVQGVDQHAAHDPACGSGSASADPTPLSHVPTSAPIRSPDSLLAHFLRRVPGCVQVRAVAEH